MGQAGQGIIAFDAITHGTDRMLYLKGGTGVRCELTQNSDPRIISIKLNPSAGGDDVDVDVSVVQRGPRQDLTIRGEDGIVVEMQGNTLTISKRAGGPSNEETVDVDAILRGGGGLLIAAGEGINLSEESGASGRGTYTRIVIADSAG